MITADGFIAAAARHGFDFYTGVPCSFLTPLINGVLSNATIDYVGAASEGEAAPRCRQRIIFWRNRRQSRRQHSEVGRQDRIARLFKVAALEESCVSSSAGYFGQCADRQPRRNAVVLRSSIL